MAEFAMNPQTGEVIENSGQGWTPVSKNRLARNPETNQTAVFDGSQWRVLNSDTDSSRSPEIPNGGASPSLRNADALQQNQYTAAPTRNPVLSAGQRGERMFSTYLDKTSDPQVGRNYRFLSNLGVNAIKNQIGEGDFSGAFRTTGKLLGTVPRGLDDVVRQVANGVSFGVADDIAARGNAAIQSATGNGSYGNNLDRNLQQERGRDKAFAKANPGGALAAEIGGALLSPANAFGLSYIGRGANLLSKAGRAAGVGAGQGAVYGFNSGEGNLENRLGSAKEGAAYGAAGGLVPGVLQGGARAVLGNSKKIAKDALQGISDEVLDVAEVLQKEAARLGAPITTAEAIAEATNSGRRVLDLQRTLETTRKGGEIMDRFFTQRPQQNREAVERAISALDPNPTAAPSALGPRLQTAGQNIVDEARRGVNRASQPLYDLSVNNPSLSVSVDDFRGLQRNPVYQSVSRSVANDPIYASRAANETSLPFVDTIQKRLNELAKQSKLAGDNEASAAYNATRQSVLEAIDRSSPTVATQNSGLVPASQQARNIQASGYRDIITPAKKSPAGRIARTDDAKAQAGLLFAKNPSFRSAKEIGDSVRELARRDPEATQNLIGQYLRDVFEESVPQAGTPFAAQQGGAQFAGKLTANAQAEKNLEAAIRALPGGETNIVGLKKLLQVLRAQGRRQAPGSQTEQNIRMTQALGQSKLRRLAKPTNIVNVLGDLLDELALRGNSGRLARINTHPQGVAMLRRLAFAKTDSAEAQRLTAGIIALTQETDPSTLLLSR